MELKGEFSEKAKYDLVLIERSMNGDQKAFAELMHRYKDSLYFMLLRMVNNPIDAEDLTIEAFGKAFRNIHQYTSNYAFSTWLFKIATNNCIDYIRRNRTKTISLHHAHEEDEYGNSFDLQETALGPEDIMIKKQRSDLLRQIVDQLKPRYKRLIQLRYFEDQSYEEIAQQLDLPIGTVKAQLFRAKDLLYNILKRTPQN